MKRCVLLIAQIFALSTEARLWQKPRDLREEKHSDDGGGPDTRIVGGYEAVEDRFGYAASLQSWRTHFCGGSLIAFDMVLSAAHCSAGSGYNVVIGRHSHDDWDGDTVQVDKEFVHPWYNFQTNNYDVMVVKLDRATTAPVVPVKLNADDDVPSTGADVTVVGWGTTSSGGSTSDELREVEVTVVSNSACQNRYGTSLIKDAMLCAADPGQDSCQGDSGGPLVLKGNSASEDIQVGVVSWGYGCADASHPGVYARVSSVHDFIKETVCTYSIDQAAKQSFGCTGATASASGSTTATEPIPTPTQPVETTITMNDNDNDNGYHYYDDFYYDDYYIDNSWNSWWTEVTNWWDNTISSWGWG